MRSKEAQHNGWTLAPRSDVLPSWSRRGRPEETDNNKGPYAVNFPTTRYPSWLIMADLAESVIRCLPGEDKTNGFFVSCFVRETAGDKAGSVGKGKRKRPDAEREPEPATDSVETNRATDAATTGDAQQPASKEKTAAQAERARRKKAAQKKRKMADGPS